MAFSGKSQCGKSQSGVLKIVWSEKHIDPIFMGTWTEEADGTYWGRQGTCLPLQSGQWLMTASFPYSPEQLPGA